MTKPRECKDCLAEGITTRRDCPWPGPRCETHQRAIRKIRRAREHERHVQVTYGLAPGEYDALCAFQNGLCAICLHARCTGVSGKKLAVDHNHLTGEPRGLACVNCNRFLLGRYDINALRRAVDYLLDPPYRRMREAPPAEMPFRDSDVHEIRRLLEEGR